MYGSDLACTTDCIPTSMTLLAGLKHQHKGSQMLFNCNMPLLDQLPTLYRDSCHGI